MYPTKAEIDGKEYPINTDYKTCLRCFEVLEDKDITDYERALAIVYLLFGEVDINKTDLFLDKVKIFLQCGETLEEQESKKKDMCFVQDKKYIVPSFLYDYGVNLANEDLHFWNFIELLQGLSEYCILSRIRNLRNIDLSKIEDPKEREEIRKEQQRFALKNQNNLSKEQEQKKKEFLKELGIEVK